MDIPKVYKGYPVVVSDRDWKLSSDIIAGVNPLNDPLGKVIRVYDSDYITEEVLTHEYAHLKLGHHSETALEHIKNEAQADRLANKVRTGHSQLSSSQIAHIILKLQVYMPDYFIENPGRSGWKTVERYIRARNRRFGLSENEVSRGFKYLREHQGEEI